ncbi:MAG: hypothetical protein MEQ07_08335 [Aquimonas sp.]|nr:hypothetical protein [Aquimonas sp.]
MSRSGFYLLLPLATLLAAFAPCGSAQSTDPESPLVGLAAPRADLGEALMQLLKGEFALQQGDSAAAARAYVEAALLSADPELAERAARIALLADDRGLLAEALRRWLQLAPDAAAARQLALVHAIREGRHEDAADGLAELFAGDEDARRLAVQALAGSGRGAVPSLRLLVEDPRLPPEFSVWVALGGLAQQWSAPDLTVRVLELAAARFPEDRRVGLWRAEVLLRQEQPEAAITALEAVLALGLGDIPERLRAASLLDGLGQTGRAAELLAEGEQTDATFAGRAAYLARVGESGALELLYGQIKSDALATLNPEDARDETSVFGAVLSDDRRFLLGQIAEVLERGDEAQRWYEGVTDPARRMQAQLRIAVLHEDAGRLEASIATLRGLQALETDEGELLRNAFLLEGELLNRRGELLASIDALNRGLQIFEDDRALLYARALTFERLDRVAEAIIDLQVLVSEDPEDADALNALGYIMTDRTDEHEEALGYIRLALQLSPDQPAILDSMGWVLFRLGRADEALDYLQRAFEGQADAEIAAHLAEVLLVLEREEEARGWWLKGIELDAENRAVQRLRERFEP